MYYFICTYNLQHMKATKTASFCVYHYVLHVLGLVQREFTPARTAEVQKWLDAPPVGREILPEDSTTPEAIAAYLADAEQRGEPDYLEHAPEIAKHARANLGTG